MQQADRDGRLVEMEIGEDVSNIERMHQIWFTGVANLSAVLEGGEDVGLLQQLLVEVGLVTFDPIEDVFEADHLWLLTEDSC